MRNRRIRVLHDGAEYYLVDRGRTRASRVITFLRPLPKEVDPASRPATVRVKTDLGECEAVASWSQGEVSVEPGNEALLDAFRGIVERYLEEFRVGRARSDSRTYHFLSVDRLPLYELSNAHPTGLSVLVYETGEAARRAADERRGIEAREIRVETTRDLPDFLAARATDGFGGALVNGRDPVFFCLDELGAPRFLRLTLDEGSGRLAHRLLRGDGEWEDYDGEEEITPELDQEVADRHMIDRIGHVPFLGYHDGLVFQRVRDPRRPDAVVSVGAAEDEGEGPPICPLFHDADFARDWLADHALDECELEPVRDLPAFADRVAREGCVLHVQPGAHRARGGAMWATRGRLILDTFSGIWSSVDGATFTHEDPTAPDA